MPIKIQKQIPEIWQEINMFQILLFSPSSRRRLISILAVNTLSFKKNKGKERGKGLFEYFLLLNGTQPTQVAD